MERVYRTDLKLLRYFLAVAEELHFGRAAARLNMSQPPLSLHIKELESQLGTLLFIRHSRSVALTHAGKVLMEESRRGLASANLALARVEQIGRGEAGRIDRHCDVERVAHGNTRFFKSASECRCRVS